MARLPNGVLIVSKRTEKQVHTALGQLISVMKEIGKNAPYSKQERKEFRAGIRAYKDLREKFSGE
jgi:hypothetical protein